MINQDNWLDTIYITRHKKIWYFVSVNDAILRYKLTQLLSKNKVDDL